MKILIICHDDDHIKKVKEAFKLEPTGELYDEDQLAYTTLAQVNGQCSRWDKIIVFKPTLGSGVLEQVWKDMFEDEIRTMLKVGVSQNSITVL